MLAPLANSALLLSLAVALPLYLLNKTIIYDTAVEKLHCKCSDPAYIGCAHKGGFAHSLACSLSHIVEDLPSNLFTNVQGAAWLSSCADPSSGDGGGRCRYAIA
jgi:hypothetical protein